MVILKGHKVGLIAVQHTLHTDSTQRSTDIQTTVEWPLGKSGQCSKAQCEKLKFKRYTGREEEQERGRLRMKQVVVLSRADLTGY